MARRTKHKYVSLVLTSILAIALVLAPTTIVHAESTELAIENIAIDWIANQTNYKKATFHVTTNKGAYDFLLEGNMSQVESETFILIDMYVPQEETYVHAQSMNTSIPDTLCDAPYVSAGTCVEAIHIHLGPVLALVLYGFAIALAIFLFVSFLIPFLESLGGAILLALEILLDGIFQVSLPWIYIPIYSNDQNVDGSIDLYIPYDVIQQALVDDGQFYLGTPSSWWFIQKVVIDLIFWQIVYYTATWIQTRVPPAPPTLAPHASFSWSPDIIAPNDEVTFVSTSFDPDGQIQSWHWWFGDGSEGYGETVSHAYSHSGFYDVRLEVTDDDGLTDETSTSIRGITFFVIPEAPLGTITIILAMVGALGLFTVITHAKNLKEKMKLS